MRLHLKVNVKCATARGPCLVQPLEANGGDALNEWSLEANDGSALSRDTCLARSHRNSLRYL